MIDHAIAYAVLTELVKAKHAIVYVNPAGLNLPQRLLDQGSVVLILEHEFRDFSAGSSAWFVRLKFSGIEYDVHVPWSATQAVLNKDGKGIVQATQGWLVNTGKAASSLLAGLEQHVAAELLTPEQRRANFRVVDGGKAPKRLPRKPAPEEWGDDDGRPVPEGA
jgi:stringent starvation protein B